MINHANLAAATPADISVWAIALAITAASVGYLVKTHGLSRSRRHALRFAAVCGALAVLVSLVDSVKPWSAQPSAIAALVLVVLAAMTAADAVFPWTGRAWGALVRRPIAISVGGLVVAGLVVTVVITRETDESADASTTPLGPRAEVLPGQPTKRGYVYGTGASGVQGLNVRTEPYSDAERLGEQLHDGDVVRVKCWARGERYVPRGDSEASPSNVWLLLREGGYVVTAFVALDEGSKRDLPRCDKVS